MINLYRTHYIIDLYNKYKHNIKSGNMFLPADIQGSGAIFRTDTNLHICFVLFFLSHLCLLLINSRLLLRESEIHLQLSL